jgi:hypothetical protein
MQISYFVSYYQFQPMLKKRLTQSGYIIIAANLFPVIGCWFFGWEPRHVFMVYALETVLIGLMTLLKMGIVTAVRKKDTWYNEGSSELKSGIFFMLFFLVHYGMFVAIQTGIFISVSGIGKEFHIGFFDFFLHWWKYLGPDTWYMLAGFLVSYTLNMLWNFVRTGQYRTVSMALLMFQPYIRIFIQQFTVILGSMFLVFGAGKIFVLVFAAAKIFFEVFVDYDGILQKTMAEMKQKSGKQ